MYLRLPIKTKKGIKNDLVAAEAFGFFAQARLYPVLSSLPKSPGLEALALGTGQLCQAGETL